MHATLFQLSNSLKKSIYGTKSHELLQFSKTADHDHLMAEQRAKPVVFRCENVPI